MKNRVFSCLAAPSLLLAAGCVGQADSNDVPAPEQVLQAKEGLSLSSSSYLGCFTDTPSPRELPNVLMWTGATIESCVAAAQQAGYLYAGLQDAAQCWAGNTLGGTLVPNAQCYDPCTANTSEMCGAPWRNSVYGVSSSATTYTLPGGGSYLALPSANGDFELDIFCNYGFSGENQTDFFADSPSVTAGRVQVTVAIQGEPTETFNDLAYGQGGADQAFASTGDEGTWPWQGVFTAVEGGTMTQWVVTDIGSAGGPCTLTVTANGVGSGSGTIVPY